jgi:hypothetical protein
MHQTSVADYHFTAAPTLFQSKPLADISKAMPPTPVSVNFSWHAHDFNRRQVTYLTSLFQSRALPAVLPRNMSSHSPMQR